MLLPILPPDEAVETVIPFLDQRRIPTIEALAKLLSDWGVNLRDSVLCELSELMRIRKIKTSPYHAQANEQLKSAHQAIAQMTEKSVRFRGHAGSPTFGKC